MKIFGKENNKINHFKKCKNTKNKGKRKKKKRSFFIASFVHFNGLPIVGLTSINNKNN